METNLKKEQIYMNHFAIHLKLTQYCKLTNFPFFLNGEKFKKSKKQIPSDFLSNKITQIRELLKNIYMSGEKKIKIKRVHTRCFHLYEVQNRQNLIHGHRRENSDYFCGDGY